MPDGVTAGTISIPTSDELPGVVTGETRATQSENVQEGETTVDTHTSGHPLLSGMNLADFPTLNAYNALKSRADEGAEDILISSSFDDPLLSAWQYGLGRVVAWMGDAGEEWTLNWLDWDKLALFWSQVIRYALPDPGIDPRQVTVIRPELEPRLRLD